MKYLKDFVQDTMYVSPMGNVDYSEGVEEGQYELMIDNKETSIYFMAEDYAAWLENRFIDKLLKVDGNVDKTTDILEFAYSRLKQISYESLDYMKAFKRIIDQLKQLES